MKRISREKFLEMSSLAAVAAFSLPNPFAGPSTVTEAIDELMLVRLVKANDKSVERVLQMKSSSQQRQHYRNLSQSFSICTAAFSHRKSSYYHSDVVLKALERIID